MTNITIEKTKRKGLTPLKELHTTLEGRGITKIKCEHRILIFLIKILSLVSLGPVLSPQLK